MDVVKISKWGNSNAIRIPKNILRSLDINLEDEMSNVEFELNLNEENQIVLTQKKTGGKLFKIFIQKL